ncbi:N-acetylmuramoyl-L-alanine amidase [Salibacterium halotolerans]|uniref:N-acetylmuramoyl-L-alanine amidase n=1 Tax=Salibacterium halotolerans TaxID=1884432 RepID=A0A1I5WVZ9_9BACI|nr:N-acetylmuramoyl-L-alanine amidase [Salibacterium halotolerans]SFQ23955.1 N-acetylmuramoyl-L-alanine amidase [Salibacterium halotolerans]
MKTNIFAVPAAAVVLTALLVTGGNTAEAVDRYSDVGPGHWAADEIEYLAEEGVATGDASGNFRPDESLTRAQASIMITNALNEESPYAGSPSFSDVSTDYWAYDSIERAAQLDIFQGKNGSFDPSGDIEKAQVAAVTARAFFGDNTENTSGSVNFEDIDDDFWAKGYIKTLVDEGVVEDTGQFEPNEPATRAEFSYYIARAMEENPGGSIDENDQESPEEETESEILYEGMVDASTPLNVRSGPGTENGVLYTLQDGSTIDVYERTGSWLKIDGPGGEGYVHGNYVTHVDEVDSDQDNTDAPAEPILEGKVTASTLMVREGPGASNESVGSLSKGETVNIYEETNGSWVLIKYNGEWAYTHSGYLDEREPGQSDTAGKTIVIDAGHGDHDPGAQGNGLIEKNVVLDVALQVQSKLDDEGVNVVMTRDDDTFVSLSGRVNIAERSDADAFISIHANAASASANGAETFYDSTYQARESRELSQAILDRLVQETDMGYRRVADTGFYVIRNTTMPSTLVELGFLTNTRDANRMKQDGYDSKAAQAIVNGIEDYYSW